jgi:predicted kinase
VPGETPIVVVTGPPASGKTTIARAVADGAGVPLLAKDAIKEVLFDALETGDVAWSMRLGVATYSLLYHLLEVQIAAGRSCVLEANFDTLLASEELRGLQRRRPFRALQIACEAAEDVLLERYAGRAGRHPGHLDTARVDGVRESIRAARWRALDLDGETLVVDTTEWSAVDVRALVDRARAWVSSPAKSAISPGRSRGAQKEPQP